MNSGLGLIIIAAVLIVGSIVVYALLMIFFPEWVGITGKAAREAHKSHQGDEESKDSFDEGLSNWQERKPKDEK